jgi:hypothetical protein
LRVDALLQVLGAFGEDQLTGWANTGLQEMAAVSGSIAAGDHEVGVDLGLAVLTGDIANEGKQFHLLGEFSGYFVFPRFPIEPSELHVGERPNGFEAAPDSC